MRQKYSFKSDVFSFAVTLWEMVARQRPWNDLTAGDIVSEVLHGARLPIPKVSLYHSLIVFAILSCCLVFACLVICDRTRLRCGLS
jgi:hypothetical protein